jgi:hypothetical protein
MADWPSKSVALIVTSPRYFDLVKYEGVQYEGSKPWSSPYAKFLDDMMGVWVEAAQQLGRFPMRASRRAPTDPPQPERQALGLGPRFSQCGRVCIARLLHRRVLIFKR